MRLQLIPVVEIFWNGTEAEVAAFAKRFSHLKRIHDKFPLYDISHLNNEDWINIINRHTDFGGAFEDSCSLFGGYVLKANDEILLLPQCCATLAEFQCWEKIIDLKVPSKNLFRKTEVKPVYIWEGHPSPEVTRVGSNLHFNCKCEDEDFDPVTKPEFQVPFEAMCDEIRSVSQQLVALGRRLQSEIGPNFSNKPLWPLIRQEI